MLRHKLRMRECGSLRRSISSDAWRSSLCCYYPFCSGNTRRDFSFSSLRPRLSTPQVEQLYSVSWNLVENLLPHIRPRISLRAWSTLPKKLLPPFLRSQTGKGSPNSGNNKGGNDSASPTVPPEEESHEELLVARATLFVLVMLALSYALYRLQQPSGRRTGWPSLLKHADTVEGVHLYDHYAQVYLEDGKVFLGLVDDAHTQERLDELRKAVVAARVRAAGKGKDTPNETSNELEVALKGTPTAESALVALGVFAWIVPFVFFPVFVMILSNSIGKSLAMTVDAGKRTQRVKEMIFRVERTSPTRFHDIAGMKEPKREITEIVDFLRHPERYTSLGAKIPTGALLLGPPGTGKTLLAKAVAGEGGVGFIPVCGSDFVELYVGMGALRVRQLFEVAKKQRCIVYIDEIDAIGLKRRGAGHGEKQEQEHTLNELLTQLDGFSSSNRGDVMILASSNVDQELLDPALIRPGRFDRIIHVDSPVLSERVDIFKVHLSHLKLVADAKREGQPEKSNDNSQPDNMEKNEKTQSSTNADAMKVDETEIASTATRAADSTVTTHSTTETTSTTTPVETSSPPTTSSSSSSSSTPSTSNETAVTVSQLQEELDAERRLQAEDAYAAFDFRALLSTKSEPERALISAYAERMSQLCPGFVGADIANVCNEGAILAAREESVVVDISHLERSIDRVLAGIEHRSRVLTPFEREVVAHHEAGHAVAGWFLHRADPLMKVSIVPRGGSALGYAQYLPNENRLRTSTEIRESISVTLGGRAAEWIFFKHLSTGASDDLRKVTQMAYSYVSSFAPRPVYAAPGTPGTRIMKPFGPTIANALDVEAKQLIDEVYQSTVQLLASKKEEMAALAQHLLKNEVLTHADVVRLLGTRNSRPSDRKKRV